MRQIKIIFGTAAEYLEPQRKSSDKAAEKHRKSNGKAPEKQRKSTGKIIIDHALNRPRSTRSS